MAPALHGDSRAALLLFFAGRRNMAAERPHLEPSALARPPSAFKKTARRQRQQQHSLECYADAVVCSYVLLRWYVFICVHFALAADDLLISDTVRLDFESGHDTSQIFSKISQSVLLCPKFPPKFISERFSYLIST